MNERIVKPSLTFKVVGEGGATYQWGSTYRWRDKKRFIEELYTRGLVASQVDKVWRMYTDKAFIIRYGDKGDVGKEYVITRARMSAIARELGIHGKSKSKTAVHLLRQLVQQAGCFITWVNDKGVLMKFASPMFYTKDVLNYADND